MWSLRVGALVLYSGAVAIFYSPNRQAGISSLRFYDFFSSVEKDKCFIFLFVYTRSLFCIVRWLIKKRKEIQRYCSSQKPLIGSRSCACLKGRLMAPRKKPVLVQQWPLGLKRSTYLLLQIGKTTCQLNDTLLTLPPIDLQAHDSPEITFQ